jgi:hypothetical protein
MPTIPENRVKLGADYWMTPKWKFGGDMVAADGQVRFGDESNLDVCRSEDQGLVVNAPSGCHC